jgi:hypothetical protein
MIEVYIEEMSARFAAEILPVLATMHNPWGNLAFRGECVEEVFLVEGSGHPLGRHQKERRFVQNGVSFVENGVIREHVN